MSGTPDIASIGLVIDATQVDSAGKSLDTLAQKGERASDAAAKFGERAAEMTFALERTAEAAKTSAAAQQQWTLGQISYIEKIKEEAAMLNMTTAEKIKYRAAQMGVSEVLAKEIAQIEEATAAQGRNSLSMNSSLAKVEALRAVHDALIGSYTRMGSALFTLGNASGATTTVLSALVSPLGLAATAVGVLGVAALSAANDLQHMNDALLLSGNYVGLTGSEMQQLAQQLGTANHNVGATTEAMTKLASSGHFTGEAFTQTSRAASDFARLTGESGDKAAAKFEQMDSGVGKFAESFNRQYHMLTEAQLEYVKQLENQGYSEQAESDTARLIADETERRLQQQRDSLNDGARAWRDFGDAATDAWGKTKEAASVLFDAESLQTELKWRKDWKAGNRTADNFFGSLRDVFSGKDNDARIAEIEAKLKKISDDNAARAKGQRIEADGQSAMSAESGLLGRINPESGYTDRLNKFNLDMLRLHRSNPDSPLLRGFSFNDLGEDDKGNPLGQVSGSGYDAAVKKLHESYFKDEKKNDTSQQRLQEQLRAYQEQERMLEQHLRALQKLDDTYHSAGLSGDDAYYSQKKLRLAEEERVELDTYDKEIAALNAALKNKALEPKRIEEINGQIKDLQAKRLAAKQQYADAEAQVDADALAARTKNEEAFQKLFEKHIEELEKASAKKEGEANKAAAKEYEKVWQETSTTVSDLMSDAIMNGGENGAKLLKRLFANLVLTPSLQLVGNDITKMLFGAKDGSGGGDGLMGSLLSKLFGLPDYSGGDMGLSSAGGGDSFGSGLDFTASPSAVAANGLAFSSAGITAFASGGAFTNGIVNKPTMAPMALFGEAGPEAIMPLTRGPDGSLGVKSQGGNGGAINVHWAPVINIDSRTDQQEVRALVSNAMRQSQAQLLDKLQRQGKIAR